MGGRINTYTDAAAKALSGNSGGGSDKQGVGGDYSQKLREHGEIGFDQDKGLGRVESAASSYLESNPDASKAYVKDGMIDGKQNDTWRYYRNHCHERMLEMKSRKEKLMKDIDKQIEQLESGDVTPAERKMVQQLNHAKQNIRETWGELMSDPPDMNQKQGKFKEKMEKKMDSITKALDEAGMAVARAGTSGGGTQKSGGPSKAANRAAQRGEVTDHVASTFTPPSNEIGLDPAGAGEEVGTGGSMVSGSSDTFGKKNMTIKEMVNAMEDNPKKVMKNLDSLSKEDRKLVQQMMQNHLQKMNQMFSMMSNISKTMHKTASSVISNMCV